MAFRFRVFAFGVDAPHTHCSYCYLSDENCWPYIHVVSRSLLHRQTCATWRKTPRPQHDEESQFAFVLCPQATCHATIPRSKGFQYIVVEMIVTAQGFDLFSPTIIRWLWTQRCKVARLREDSKWRLAMLSNCLYVDAMATTDAHAPN